MCQVSLFAAENTTKVIYVLIDSAYVAGLCGETIGDVLNTPYEAFQVIERTEEMPRGNRRSPKDMWVIALTLGLMAFTGVSPRVMASPGEYYVAGGASPEDSECTQNSDCKPGFYCEKAMGDCDGQGRCSPRPEVCMELYKPVCGCDGVTYGNACKAAQAGVSEAHDGLCTP